MNYAIILAGGIGSRFWPLSRDYLPKQFLKVIGKQTFFESTLSRTKMVIPARNIFVVTSYKYLKEIKKGLIKFGIPAENIILEPRPLNTLPAISVCAQLISLKDTQANLLIAPSDHYIKDKLRFKQDIYKALDLSEKGFLCLIGIRPDKLRLGYGCIESADKIEDNIFYVRSFKEKPPLNALRKLFQKKNIFYNSGIFCFKAQVLLRELERHSPCLYQQVYRIKQKQDIKKVWARIKAVSIDYGLLEQSKNLTMVEARFFWHDLGSWDTLFEVLHKDKQNNVILSNNVNFDSSNNLIFSQDGERLIATLGLSNTVIVDTKDALLVCRKDKVQDIKRLVEALKKKRKTCV